MASSTTKVSPLLELPAELRNEIYTLVLTHPGRIDLPNGKLQPPALLDTCKQVRREAVQLFFGINQFHWTLTDTEGLLDNLYRSLNRIGVKNARLITSFTISITVYEERHKLNPNEMREQGVDRIMRAVCQRNDWVRAPRNLVKKGLIPDAVTFEKSGPSSYNGEGDFGTLSAGQMFEKLWMMENYPDEAKRRREALRARIEARGN